MSVILLAVPAVTFAALVALAIVEAVAWSDEGEARHVPIFIVRNASRQPGWPVALRPNWRGRRRR